MITAHAPPCMVDIFLFTHLFLPFSYMHICMYSLECGTVLLGARNDTHPQTGVLLVAHLTLYQHA